MRFAVQVQNTGQMVRISPPSPPQKVCARSLTPLLTTDVGMMSSVVYAAELVRDVTKMRDSYLRYVVFHKEELEMIGRKVVEMKKLSGEKETTPVVIMNMLNRWYEWEILFSA
jgi:hypothetical protein